MKLNPTSVPTATNSLSLINLIGDSCIASTSSSTSFFQDFSALLTEMTGPTVDQPVDAGSDGMNKSEECNPATKVAAAETLSTLGQPQQSVNWAAVSTKPTTTSPAQLGEAANLSVVVATEPKEGNVAGLAESSAGAVNVGTLLAVSTKDARSQTAPTASTDPGTAAAAPSVAQSGEMRKTAVTVHQATSDKAAAQSAIVVLLVPFQHSTVSQLTFAGAATDSNAARIDAPMVTTDPVRNVAQQQLPPRIMPVMKVVPEANPADRSKPSATAGKDVVAGAPPSQFTEVVRPIERVDQAPAAHTIEIPNISNLPVVRIVPMQVGDADYEVTIRVQQRGTDLTLHLNAANCRLHQNLQSAVGSLANALKLEDVPVSGIEVSPEIRSRKIR
jgi:hypothetical protein